MTKTTNSDFHADTEALEVAKVFPESIQGKTILVTGVNREGIGFATSEAFVGRSRDTCSQSYVAWGTN